MKLIKLLTHQYFQHCTGQTKLAATQRDLTKKTNKTVCNIYQTIVNDILLGKKSIVSTTNN